MEPLPLNKDKYGRVRFPCRKCKVDRLIDANTRLCYECAPDGRVGRTFVAKKQTILIIHDEDGNEIMRELVSS